MAWNLVNAGIRFEEVVRRAIEEGPQRITGPGEAVMMIAESDYRRLTGGTPEFLARLAEGPSLADVPIVRDRTMMRDADL